MRILAIDSSIRNIGWAILETDADIDHGEGLLGSGTLRTKEVNDPDLVYEIRDLLKNLIKLNNQDFPEIAPLVDVDPAAAPYSKLNAEALAGLRIRFAVIEKAEGFTYSRSTKGGGRLPGKTLNAKEMQRNHFAVGIIAATLAEMVETIQFVTPKEWKGSTSKATTRLVVNNTFSLKLLDYHNDQADAIAIGCWWIRRWTLDQKIAAQENE